MRRTAMIVVSTAGLAAVALIALWLIAVAMPGRSFRAMPPPLTEAQTELREALHHHVRELASRIGERNDVLPDRLAAAASYVEDSFIHCGLKPARQTFMAGGIACSNIETEIRGVSIPDEIVVVGAHYDSVDESPGADDNGSGVAALLALALRFASLRPARTIRFVAFVNEEPPHFQTDEMGSVVYARRCAERHEKIVAMLSLESLGYFNDAEESQAYPAILGLFYPTRGNFIAFAGNLSSRSLVRRSIRAFRAVATIPSEGAALPQLIPEIGWSDQWSFWRFGYPGIMVTDTAPFRNPNYHTTHDSVDTLDVDRLARATDGLFAVIDALSSR